MTKEDYFSDDVIEKSKEVDYLAPAIKSVVSIGRFPRPDWNPDKVVSSNASQGISEVAKGALGFWLRT